jgi:hypothetical protein
MITRHILHRDDLIRTVDPTHPDLFPTSAASAGDSGGPAAAHLGAGDGRTLRRAAGAGERRQPAGRRSSLRGPDRLSRRGGSAGETRRGARRRRWPTHRAYLIRPASLILLGNSQLSCFNPCFGTRSASRIACANLTMVSSRLSSAAGPASLVLGVWTGWQCPCYGLAATLGSHRSRAPSSRQGWTSPRWRSDMAQTRVRKSLATPFDHDGGRERAAGGSGSKR